jgi:hypothetical protein
VQSKARKRKKEQKNAMEYKKKKEKPTGKYSTATSALSKNAPPSNSTFPDRLTA